MGRIGIVYFSGTGNTWTIARQYAEEFLDHGQQVEFLPVEEVIQDCAYHALADYDLLGLGYPVHVWNAPRLMDWFISQLPPVQGQKAFVFVTADHAAAGALDAIRARLTSLGYDVIHDTCYHIEPDRRPLKPGAHVTPEQGERDEMKRNPQPISEPEDNAGNAAVGRLAQCSAGARGAALEILAGTQRHEAARANARFLLSNLAWRIYRSGCRHVHRLFFTNEQCDQCALCIQTCPTANIRLLDGRVLFDTRCTLCLRCLNICPVDAVQLTSRTRRMKRYLAPGYAQVVYRDYQR